MFPVDGLILVAGVLVLFAIASSKFSSRMGLPVLVIFLAVGMLAGSEGIGGIDFESYALAHGIGTLALAVILFDGGLRTPISSFRIAVKPAVTLATVGVVVTAVITGVAASVVLELSLLEGVLLGSIVGSTDAAAVFSLLRGRGLHLRRRVAATTVSEIEEFYGLRIGSEPHRTLGALVADEHGPDPPLDAAVVLGDVVLHVREVGPAGPEVVGLEISVPIPDDG